MMRKLKSKKRVLGSAGLGFINLGEIGGRGG